jgi:AraC-like DNA-binding protein
MQDRMAIELTVEPPVRGLLKSDIRDGERILRWFEPAEPLVPFVQRIWSAEWKIPPGESRTQPILPYPSANIVIAGGQAMVIGVVTRAAVQRLEGTGHAFGAKLQPGALRAFGVERPSALRDLSVSAEKVLRGDYRERDSGDPETWARSIEAYLMAQNPRHDITSCRAGEITRAVEGDRDIVFVSQLADKFRLSIRSIQDVCSRALGVSPKWLIRCFRLQDALERLHTGVDVNLSMLAQDLGYFDQAHFTRDFKHITGISPGRY